MGINISSIAAIVCAADRIDVQFDSFRRDIKENIAYGKPEASQRKIVAAAQAANADEFIASWKKARLVIGERGATSRAPAPAHRIARALIRDAPILILDEAETGSTWRAKQSARGPGCLMAGKTCLLITTTCPRLRTRTWYWCWKKAASSPRALTPNGGQQRQVPAAL